MARRFNAHNQAAAGRAAVFANRDIAAFTKEIEDAGKRSMLATEEGMRVVVDMIASRAIDFTPLDTGNLTSTQRRRVIKESGKIIGEITYNENGEAPYAAFVHEVPKNYGGRPEARFKYLQSAFQEKRREAIKILEDHWRQRR